jgi:hypothetical protein
VKSSLAPLKYVIGRWTHPMTTSVYMKKKNVRVTMELEVPKRFISKNIFAHSNTISAFYLSNWTIGKKSTRRIMGAQHWFHHVQTTLSPRETARSIFFSSNNYLSWCICLPKLQKHHAFSALVGPYTIHCHSPRSFTIGEAKEVLLMQCQGTMAEKCCIYLSRER